MEKKLRIKLIKSLIGVKENHRNTVKSLGLKKLNSSVEQPNTADVIGKVKQVSYLLNVEEV